FPDIDPQSWFGLFATAGTPRDVIEKIQKDVATVFAQPEFQKRLQALAFEPVVSTPDEFAKFIAEDLAYKKKLIATTGIKAEERLGHQHRRTREPPGLEIGERFVGARKRIDRRRGL